MWEADLLLCVLLYVIHLAGGSPLGPLKQTGTTKDAENTLSLFLKNPPVFQQGQTHFPHKYSRSRIRELV